MNVSLIIVALTGIGAFLYAIHLGKQKERK